MKIVRLKPHQHMEDGPGIHEILGCYAIHENTIYLTNDANTHIFIHELLHVVTTRFFHRFLPGLEDYLDVLINKFF